MECWGLALPLSLAKPLPLALRLAWPGAAPGLEWKYVESAPWTLLKIIWPSLSSWLPYYDSLGTIISFLATSLVAQLIFNSVIKSFLHFVNFPHFLWKVLAVMRSKEIESYICGLTFQFIWRPFSIKEMRVLCTGTVWSWAECKL